MRTNFKDTGREFKPTPGIVLKDLGEIQLDADEQITVTTESGASNDVARKSWGFYLTNSLNHTLRNRGFRTALVVSETAASPRLFINLVEESKIDEFLVYLSENKSRVLTWLDTWLPADA